MSPAVAKVEREFRKLKPLEQAELLERFAKVVYGDDDEDPAFAEMLKRRIAEIETGAVTRRDAFEVLREIKGKYSR